MIGHLEEFLLAALICMFSTQPRCLRFQSLSQPITLEDVPPCRHADSGPHTRSALHQAVYLQMLQRFRYRQEAHPKFFCQLASGQGSSQRIMAAKNSIAYPLVRPVR